MIRYSPCAYISHCRQHYPVLKIPQPPNRQSLEHWKNNVSRLLVVDTYYLLCLHTAHVISQECFKKTQLFSVFTIYTRSINTAIYISLLYFIGNPYLKEKCSTLDNNKIKFYVKEINLFLETSNNTAESKQKKYSFTWTLETELTSHYLVFLEYNKKRSLVEILRKLCLSPEVLLRIRKTSSS